ncbi:MAG: hypothetical protein ABS54_01305 [Hyphomicrobium sp. SCN 65-11]|nr:MAG: hypothetical protein ABS54_01305 [Hyphomicrobium sp. SCN 65-11]
MRQGQQHRRGRSRGSSGGNGSHGHHHRKGQNPLARSFESNGPDVKVRGTAADIAAKYIALARDAQSSGDPVLAENYLQHAEHYNRMIIAYREQQMQQGGEAANGQRHRPQGMDMGEGEEAEGDTVDPGMGDQPAVPAFARHPGQEPQPQSQPRHENGRHDERRDERRDDRRDDRREDRRQQGRQQEHRQDRGEHPRFRDRRFERPDYRNERAERNEGGDEPRHVREPAPTEQPQPVIEAGDTAPPREQAPREREQAPRRRERFDMMKDQPEFLRRPVRRPRREETPEGGGQDGGTQEKSGA